MTTENQVTKLFNDANDIAAMVSEEITTKPDPDVSSNDAEDIDRMLSRVDKDSMELVQYLQPLLDKYIKSHADDDLSLRGIVDGLAMVLCIVARGASSNEETYWKGTKDIFEANLDHVDNIWEKYQKH